MFILLALIIAMFIGGVYILYRPTPNTSLADQAQVKPEGHGVTGDANLVNDSFDVAIMYTDHGFATTSITIKQGTRVRFLNDSNEQVWPASGIHPTHTLYPEKGPTDCLGSSFDSCAALVRGEFFDFTFYYLGSWTFHDHVHPYQTGEIIVTE